MLVIVAAMSKSERKLPKRSAVMFVYDGVQVLDVAGTAQALTTANEEGAAPQYDLRLCALAPGAVTTASGFAVMAESLPRARIVDTIFIPGGPGVHRIRLSADAISTLLRLCRRARRICAICTGAFMLAETGMLDNKTAVTHWRSCARFAREFPKKLAQIAGKTGFRSESALRRALQRQFGATARDLRERF
jgi:transcriptional regulator GlxA family with amidase domain